MRALIQFSLDRPKRTILAWIIVLAVAAPFAARLAGELRGSTDAVPGSPSELVSQDVNRSFGKGSAFVFPATLTSGIPTSDPRFAATARNLERVLDSAGMNGVRHYWNTGDATLLGRDGHSALLLVTPRAGSFFDAESMVDRIRTAAAEGVVGSTFEVKVTGMISLFHDLDVNASDDLLRAERIGIPLTLVVLLFVFGAPIAAGLPLVLALGTIAITLAVLYGLSRVMPVSVFAQNAVTMVGLGIGVDYALFLVSRCREELAGGASLRTSVERAASHAGHVVQVSGLAVCTGFLALFLVHIRFLHTLAIGGVAVVVTSVLMTLTLLPALLLLIGERLNWPRRLSRRSTPSEGLWARWAAETMNHPWRYLIPSLIILAALALPTLRLKTWNMGVHDLSPAMEARQGYDILDRNFAPGWMGPIAVVVKTRDSGSVWTSDRESAIASIYSRLATDPRVRITGGFPQLLAALGPSRPLIKSTADLPASVRAASSGFVSADGRTALIYLVPRSAPESHEVMTLVRELRGESWGQATQAGLSVETGGFSASILDFNDELFGSLKRVIPVVLTITFIVLVLAFRSIVVPLKAIAMNLASVLAAYGFLVYVFQDGVGASMIGLIPPGGLNSFIVLMLFTILFGLSMDYEVFLLSRIKEEYQRSGNNRESIVSGLSHTGGLITSAALIMVVLFGSFGFTKLTATREFGLGLAFAVALDATIIRVVLVPILMGLLGKANWWFPAALLPGGALRRRRAGQNAVAYR